MIDNIVTNTLLPALSREFLTRSLAKEELKEAKVTVRERAVPICGDVTCRGNMAHYFKWYSTRAICKRPTLRSRGQIA